MKADCYPLSSQQYMDLNTTVRPHFSVFLLLYTKILIFFIKGDGTEPTTLNEDEEDDEVVKSIIRSQNRNTNHPPPITTEDHVVDICFHPNSDMIAIANIVGDVYL